MENEFALTVISPSRTIYDGTAYSIILPLYDGMAGILKDHVNIISHLGPGKLIIKSNGDIHTYFVSGGFVEVKKGFVTILVDQAYKKEEIQKQVVEKELQEIKSQQAIGDEQINEKLHKLKTIYRKISFLNQ